MASMDIDSNHSSGAEETKVNTATSSDTIIETVDAPNFDLEAYAARYSGYTKIQRLLFIAEHCKGRELDAYKMAIDILKQGIDVNTYRKVSNLVGERLGEGYAYDASWVESVEKKANMTKERLEGDLQSARSSMAKESIRVGYNYLGDFHYRRGDLDESMKNYLRTRDFCSTTRHTIEMCLNVIKVSVGLSSFVHVNNYVSKGEHTPELNDLRALAKLKAVSGLSQLNQQCYAAAARKFLECSSELLPSSSSSSSSSTTQGNQGTGMDISGDNSGEGNKTPASASSATGSFSEVIAPEDIAVYGGLCALASFDRKELKEKVVESVVFKGYLDLVPQTRELIYDFCQSRYGSCLQALEELRPELLLDLHLRRHVDILYKHIRERCLLQFFAPYLSVDLERMAEAFHCPLQSLETEMAELIMKNRLTARIDSQKKALHRRQVDQRDDGYRRIFAMGQDFLREMRAMVLRLSLLEHGVLVESSEDRERGVEKRLLSRLGFPSSSSSILSTAGSAVEEDDAEEEDPDDEEEERRHPPRTTENVQDPDHMSLG